MRRLLVSLALLNLHCSACPELVLHHLRHADDVRDVYSALPERGRDVRINVYELKQARWDSTPRLLPQSVGMMFPGTVYLLEQRADRVRLTFAHEYGHIVYYQAFTDNERADWALWWSTHQELMPRDYARTDASEGWAESFMATYLPNARFDPMYWGFPKGYKPDTALTTKVRSYFLSRKG